MYGQRGRQHGGGDEAARRLGKGGWGRGGSRRVLQQVVEARSSRRTGTISICTGGDVVEMTPGRALDKVRCCGCAVMTSAAANPRAKKADAAHRRRSQGSR